MAEERKRFDRYPQYYKLSDEQQQEFKKGLFLTKGAVNNDVGCLLASLGLTGEDIAKYGASWKDAEGVDQGCVLGKRKPRKNARAKLTRKRLVQQAARIPDLFDTIRGRALVAKYGDEVKEEFCDGQGRCPLSVVSKDTDCDKLLSGVEFQEGSASEYAFSSIKQDVIRERNMGSDNMKRARYEFLERAKATEVVKAKSKKVDLAGIYADCMCSDYNVPHSMSEVPEFKKDFWGFVEQDCYALANAPSEFIEQQLRVPSEADYKDLSLLSTSLGKQLTGYYSPSVKLYNASPDATYNSLYVRAMYQALDEMGVGLATTHRISNCARGYLYTRVRKITKKVITLNEKYQKMLKNKSNKIEPAILRQTLVGMFNEYADRSNIEYRMFVREDRPAPTLEDLFPAKSSKSTKATPTRAHRKRSTGPKTVVKVEGVGTFVEY